MDPMANSKPKQSIWRMAEMPYGPRAWHGLLIYSAEQGIHCGWQELEEDGVEKE